MTLSQRIETAGERRALLAAASDWFGEELAAPIEVSAAALFQQHAPGDAFRLTGWLPFAT